MVTNRFLTPPSVKLSAYRLNPFLGLLVSEDVSEVPVSSLSGGVIGREYVAGRSSSDEVGESNVDANEPILTGILVSTIVSISCPCSGMSPIIAEGSSNDAIRTRTIFLLRKLYERRSLLT